MRKTQTKTALMKIKKVSFLSTKMFFSPLLFSFIFSRKVWNIFLFCFGVCYFLGGGNLAYSPQCFFCCVFVWGFFFLNKCSSLDCSLQNASVLKYLNRMLICFIKKSTLLIALHLQKKKGKRTLIIKETHSVYNNFTPKKATHPLSTQITWHCFFLLKYSLCAEQLIDSCWGQYPLRKE